MDSGESKSLKARLALIVSVLMFNFVLAAHADEGLVPPEKAAEPTKKTAPASNPNEKIPVEVAGDKLEYLRDQKKSCRRRQRHRFLRECELNLRSR